METLPLQFVAPVVDELTRGNRMVKSVTLDGHGKIARMKVNEAPLDYALKSDYVEVQVAFCGLNFTDNYLRLGIIRNVNFPVVMGSECCGFVLRYGSAVTDLERLQIVLCLKMQGGLFRHVIQVPRKHCFLVPPNINCKDAVALGLNYLVAHICLFELGCIKPEDVIFMQSIAGGIGTAVTQLCKTVQNVQVLGTASEYKHEALKSDGVKSVFRHDDYVQEVLKAYPEGVDLIINSNGGTDIEKCLKMLKRCGTLVLIGSNCTAIYSKTKLWGMMRPIWDPQTVSSAELINKNYTVAGVNIGLLLETYPEMMQSIVTKLFELFSSGTIRPRIHSTLRFEKVEDGITQLCTRANYGKIVLAVKLSPPDHCLGGAPSQAYASETLPGEEPIHAEAQGAAVKAEPLEAEQERVTATGQPTEEQPKHPEEQVAAEAPKEVIEPQ